MWYNRGSGLDYYKAWLLLLIQSIAREHQLDTLEYISLAVGSYRWWGIYHE